MPKPPSPDLPATPSESDATLKQRETNRRYYEANKDRLKQYARDYTKQNKANVSAYKKEYHLRNRERLIAKSRRWVQENPEKRRAYAKQWVLDNYEKNKAYQNKYRLKLKMEVFEYYGGARCSCCGEESIQFLTIDHIDGNGAAHRKSITSRGGREFYQWLRSNNFPPGYQVLCWNCNSARGAYGYCHVIPQPTVRQL